MQRNTVESSNLTSVGYNEPSEVLEAEFRGGAVYQYKSVLLHIYQGLTSASSKGTYHHTFVKNAYLCVRIS